MESELDFPSVDSFDFPQTPHAVDDYPLFADVLNDTTPDVTMVLDGQQFNGTDDFSDLLDPNSREDIDALISNSNPPPALPQISEEPSLEGFGLDFETQQSASYEANRSPNFYQTSDVPTTPPSSSIQIGSAPSESVTRDYNRIANEILTEQREVLMRAARMKKMKSSNHSVSRRTVGPVGAEQGNYGSCQPCTTAELPFDARFYQASPEQFETKKIQIKCQPRSKFRPRTQNERKSGSHYIRCEEGAPHDYPTIYLKDKWPLQSVDNLIEVALVTVDQQPHPYPIDNKNGTNPLQAQTAPSGIVKTNDGLLYFRLTNDDFQKGFKSFQIELIKSRQDDIITKRIIQERQLEHSMLRFARVYLDQNGQYVRDDCTEEFSEIMSEAYGDVAVEHSGPQLGSMAGSEMYYIILKGRILKGDLNIEVVGEDVQWTHPVTNFTKNGNVVHFHMPAFPDNMMRRVKCNVVIYYKQMELDRFVYFYEATVDQLMAELSLTQSNHQTEANVNDIVDPFNLLTMTGLGATLSSTRKSSTAKRPKRLGK